MPKKISKEQELQLVADRLAGVDRKELGRRYGLTLAGIKSVLLRNKISIPMEQRQKNAYGSKLVKNPDAMARMRTALTPEVVTRRSASIADRYSKDKELRDLKGRQSRDWWKKSGPDSKYDWKQVDTLAQELGMVGPGLRGPVDAPEALVTCFCGNRFAPRVYDFLYLKIRSCGCVKSRPQAELISGLQARGLRVSSNDRTVIPPLELDIWIPDKNVAIEYCGLHWHGDRWGKGNRRHLDKLEACERLGIRLITVFSDEWNQSQELVWGYIGAILGWQQDIIGARELECKPLGSSEAQVFWEKYHIQGRSATPSAFGLFRESELIAALGCRPSSSSRKGAADPGFWELSRYAVRPGIRISGGFSRLWKAFHLKENPETVVTFSDLRWSQGGLYSRHGFKKTARQPPSYFYFRRNTDGPRWHKSQFRKATLEEKGVALLPGETEWEAVQRLGVYDRIWDCGKDGWVWIRP